MNTIDINALRTEDVRLEMAYDEVYERTDESDCTVARCVLPGAYVVKQHWANRPLGQIYTRCQGHQAAFDESKVGQP